jgi:hypothetical protein
MRGRILHQDSIIAYRNKNELRKSVDLNTFTHNAIDGNTLALRKAMPDNINTTNDWIKFIARCLAIDISSLDMMFYISSQSDAIDRGIAKLSFPEYSQYCKDNMQNEISQDSFYMCIRALTMVYCIQKTPDTFMYHVNRLYFTPQPRFKVSVYFVPNEMNVQDTEED